MYVAAKLLNVVIFHLGNLEFMVCARVPAIKCLFVFFGNGCNDKGSARRGTLVYNDC